MGVELDLSNFDSGVTGNSSSASAEPVLTVSGELSQAFEDGSVELSSGLSSPDQISQPLASESSETGSAAITAAAPTPVAASPIHTAAIPAAPVSSSGASSSSSVPSQPISVSATVTITLVSSSSAISISGTTATTSTGSSLVKTVSTPSWILNLSNASIKTDMTAAAATGTVSYAGLDKLFLDVESLISTQGSGLTSSEFSDLKTIAADLNLGLTTSSYLTYVTNALVNGNVANATWTGGGSTSVSLGNMTTGSSLTQFTELVNKWLTGSDDPSSKYTLSGKTYSYSYSTPSNVSVFSSSGPAASDINQGMLGDCYLLASLAEVATQDKSAIQSMFQNNNNGSYGIRFYVNGQQEWVTVDSSLLAGGKLLNSGGSYDWASLVEKAYAQLQTGQNVTGNTAAGSTNSYTSMGNGGYVEKALLEITGCSQITDYCGLGSSWSSYTLNNQMYYTGYSSGNTSTTVQNSLISALKAGDDVVLVSYTNAYDSAHRQTLVASHAMSITGYDTATGLFQIRNPWGTEAGQYWDTTFEVSLSTLMSLGDTIVVDNLNGAAATLAAPVSTIQTTTLAAVNGQSFGLSLNGTIYDPQAETLTIKAVQANGSALPSWLSFNSQTMSFSGTAPSGSSSSYSVVITATDSSGLVTTQTITLYTGDLSASSNSLSTSAIAALTATQIANLTSTQVAALTTTQISALSSTQAAALTTLDAAALKSSQLNALTASAIASLSTQDIAALNGSAIAGLSSSSAAALTSNQIAALTATEAGYLSSTGLAGFTSTQLDSFTTTAFAALAATAVASLSSTQFAGLTTQQIANLKSTQLAALTKTEYAALTTAQFLALTATEIKSVTSSGIASLSTKDIAALTSTQATALSSSQIGSLTSSQIAALTAPALAALSSSQMSQLASESINGKYALAYLTTAQDNQLASATKNWVLTEVALASSGKITTTNVIASN